MPAQKRTRQTTKNCCAGQGGRLSFISASCALRKAPAYHMRAWRIRTLHAYGIAKLHLSTTSAVKDILRVIYVMMAYANRRLFAPLCLAGKRCTLVCKNGLGAQRTAARQARRPLTGIA